MANRIFSDRLHHELNAIGMPERYDERIETFAKVFKTPRYKAEAILNGNVKPDEQLLQKLAQELEVNADWLLGEDRRKH